MFKIKREKKSLIVGFFLISMFCFTIFVEASGQAIYFEDFDNETEEMEHYFSDDYNSTYNVNGTLNMKNEFPNEFYEEDWNNWSLTSDNYATSTFNDNGTLGSWLVNGTKSTGMWEAYPTLQFDTTLDVSDDKITWSYDAFGQLIKVNNTIQYYFTEMANHGYDDNSHLVRKDYNLTSNTWNDRVLINTSYSYAGGGVINDTIFLWTIYDNDTGDAYWVRIKSLDGLVGEVWSEPSYFGSTSFCSLTSTNDSGTFLKNWQNTDIDGNHSYGFTKTTDYGDTWSLWSDGVVYNGSIYWCEVSTTHIGNGSLISLLRDNDGGQIGQSISSDNGLTWSEPVRTNLGEDDGDVEIPTIKYDEKTNKIIVIYRDRDGDFDDVSETKLSISNATIVFNNATAYNEPEVIFKSNRRSGYGSMVKVSDNKWFYVFSDDVVKGGDDADMYGGFLEYYNDTYNSISKTLNHTFRVLDFNKTQKGLIPYNLQYSYKTNISQEIDFSVWNFDTLEWNLVNISTNNVSYYDCSFALNSSHYNSTFDVLLNWYGLNGTNEFDLNLNYISVDYNWTWILGEIYALIDRELDFSFLNNYDSGYDDYLKLYNITVNFQYRFTNYTNYDDIALINNTSLITDGNWYYGSHSFEFDSLSLNSTYIGFNISNGLLEVQNLNYSIFYTCVREIQVGDSVTYDFTGETGLMGTSIPFIDSMTAGGDLEVVTSKTTQSEVLYFNSVAGFTYIENHFVDKKTNNTITFKIYFDANNDYHYIRVYRDTTIQIQITFNIIGNIEYYDGTEHIIGTYLGGQWYDVKIHFDSGGFELFVDDIQQGGDNLGYWNAYIDGINKFGFITYQQTGHDFWVDDIEYDWSDTIVDYNQIYQNFTLEPILDLTTYQKTISELELQFDYNFTTNSDLNLYNFWNGINNSLLLFNVSIQHESGWNSSYYNYNTSRIETFSFNISDYLDILGKSQFLGFKLEIFLSGSVSILNLDNVTLLDYYPDVFFPLISNVKEYFEPSKFGDNVSIYVDVEDPSGVLFVYLEYENTNYSMIDLGNTTYMYSNWIPIDYGNNSYVIWAGDNPGNNGFYSGAIWVLDTVFPIISNVKEYWNPLEYGNSITIFVDIYEIYLLFVYIEYENINYSMINLDNTTYMYSNWTPTAYGINSYVIYAGDLDGNIAIYNGNILVQKEEYVIFENSLFTILAMINLVILMSIMLYLYSKVNHFLPVLITFLFSIAIGINAFSVINFPFTPYFQIFFILFQTIIFYLVCIKTNFSEVLKR